MNHAGVQPPGIYLIITCLSRMHPNALQTVSPRIDPGISPCFPSSRSPSCRLHSWNRPIPHLYVLLTSMYYSTTTTLTESSPPEVDFGAIHVHLGTLTTPPSSVLRLMRAARPDQSGDLQFSVNLRKILSLTAL